MAVKSGSSKCACVGLDVTPLLFQTKVTTMELDLSQAFDKNRKRAVRHEHDAYMTPPALVEAIVNRVAQYVANPTYIVEPACGDGEFVAAVRKKWPNAGIAAIDIRPEVGPKITTIADRFIASDFLKTPPAVGADLIIGNPPYSLHTEFIGHALNGMRDGATLAFLLRFNMLVGSRDTQEWWTREMSLPGGLSPNRQIVNTLPIFPRPSFTGTGTDATEYMLAIFRKGFDNGGRFDPVKWDKPQVKRGRKPKNNGIGG